MINIKLNVKLKLKKILKIFLEFSIFALALWALYYFLKDHSYHEIMGHFLALEKKQVLLSLGLTLLGYLALSSYDYLGAAYAQKPIPYKNALFISFISYAIGNNISFSNLGTSAIRFRFYSNMGYNSYEIIKIISFCTLSFWLGLLTLSSLVFTFDPLHFPLFLQDKFHLKISSSLPLGICFLGLIFIYLGLSLFYKKTFSLKGLELNFPSFKTSIHQILFSSLDWFCAGFAYYILLPSDSVSLGHFLTIYFLAQTIALIGHVPGGLGVLEVILIFFLSSPQLSPGKILGISIAYRIIYYFIPLFLAILTLIFLEIKKKEEVILSFLGKTSKTLSSLIPLVFYILAYASGILLLLSGATPTLEHRLEILDRWIPFSLLELSHFLGSLSGFLLLFLARGLQRRLYRSYLGVLMCLICGIFFSLFKGLDYEEASILIFVALILFLSRKEFFRVSRMREEILSFESLLIVSLGVVTSIWAGLVSYKHVSYSPTLWTQFELFNDASRFMRSSAGISLFFFLLLVFSVYKRKRFIPQKLNQEDGIQLKKIIHSSERTMGFLAYLEDKFIMFGPQKKSFLMYGISGDSWIVLGDPIGDGSEYKELLWLFKLNCEKENARPVFYQVSKNFLDLYIDLGMTFLKLGEEARVDLAHFDLGGRSKRSLRHNLSTLEKLKVSFEIAKAPLDDHTFQEIKKVSESWLKNKKGKEKGFSLGFFKDDYIKNSDCALVRYNGSIVAFANLWNTNNKNELSIDLMRYTHEAPKGLMDFLFLKLFLWGKDESYLWFNLGMAPLSGLNSNPMGPKWNQLGSLLFNHGEMFYNFQGLRDYKDKFDPQWEARYLAIPGISTLPSTLIDITTLISKAPDIKKTPTNS